MEKMREIVLCVLVAAVSLSAHCGMAREDVGSNSKEHFRGLDGLCLTTNPYNDYKVPTHLSPCEADKEGQVWTFYNDATIRFHDKCLVPQNSYVGDYAVLVNCYETSSEEREWKMWEDGTVTHLQSGLVLTANPAIPNPLVTLEHNKYAPSQSWDVAGDTSPLDINIMSFNKMCLQAQEGSPRVRLGSCKSYTGKKPWVLYSDGTIRLNANQHFCLTSAGTDPYSAILLSNCQGKTEQRWNLKKDNTIDNPKTRMVLDVKGSNPYVQQIVVNERNGYPTQQWTIL